MSIIISINKRFDLFFSYWIDVWCLVYIIYHYNEKSKYRLCNMYNPKFILILAIFINIIELLSMIYFENSSIHIVLYIIIVGIGKGIPLTYLRNTKICQSDIYASILLFFMYLLWLYWNGVTLYDYVRQAYENVKNNHPVGPVTKYFMNYF